jgi:hypothetical protein
MFYAKKKGLREEICGFLLPFEIQPGHNPNPRTLFLFHNTQIRANIDSIEFGSDGSSFVQLRLLCVGLDG